MSGEEAESPQGRDESIGTRTGDEPHDATVITADNSPFTAHDYQKPIEIEKESSSKKSSTIPIRCPTPDQNDPNLEENFIVTFYKDDPANPYNWGQGKKTYVLLTCMALVLNSTIGSALPVGARQEIQDYFNITNESLLVLPVSIYLIGYVLGPLVRLLEKFLLSVELLANTNEVLRAT